MIKSQTCVKNCDFKLMNEHLCEINYISQKDETKEENKGKTEEEIKKQEDIKKKDTISNSITETLTSGEYNLTNLENGANEVFEVNGAKFTITTTSNQKNNTEPNETSIDLGHCEDLLRKHYNIPNNDNIFMKKIDVKIDGMKIPVIEYEVYAKLGGDN